MGVEIDAVLMAAAKAPDQLDLLAAGDLRRVIGLMLWKDRYRNPELALQIHPADLKGLDDCTAYLGVEPQVIVRRPPGQPAIPAIPPSKRFPDGLPARAAEPARPYVLVSMVDTEGNAIKPIENSEDGAKIRDRENELRGLRERAPLLAQTVAGNAANNVFSGAEITELCNTAILLARST